MKYKMLLMTAVITLLFTACNNNSTNQNSITTTHQKYIVTHKVAEDAKGVDFSAIIELPIGEDENTLNIRNSLTYKMCGDSYKGHNNIQHALEILYNDVNTKWKAAYDEYTNEDDSTFMFHWDYYHHIKPIFQAQNIVCYESEFYRYAGGVHGLTDVNYFVYDLLSSRELNDRDIYNFDNPETEDAINALLQQAYAKRCEKDEDLSQYKLDEPRMNNNFTITEDSIIYLYNQYEIAAYCAGQITLGIAKEELFPYLQKNTTLYKYWKH